MIILAALVLGAASEQAPPVQRVSAERQAYAMVRILPGAQIRFAELEHSAPERFTDTHIRTADGSSAPARLIEFH